MAKKTKPPWGQHFLHEQRVLQRIASSLPITPGALVVEIGAGQGQLTEHLLERSARVAAVEIDPQLARFLRNRFTECKAFEVIEADVLEVDLGELIAERCAGRALIAGNLPYYITSPILRRLFAAADRISEAVLLMQREVARRVVAEKGSRDYGYLSALCRLYAEPEYLFPVSSGAFRPPPEVTSAAVRLKMRQQIQADPDFLKFLQRSFRQPRKTLLNNLSAVYPRAVLADLPECRRRAQEMDLPDLKALWEKISAAKTRSNC